MKYSKGNNVYEVHGRTVLRRLACGRWEAVRLTVTVAEFERHLASTGYAKSAMAD